MMHSVETQLSTRKSTAFYSTSTSYLRICKVRLYCIVKAQCYTRDPCIPLSVDISATDRMGDEQAADALCDILMCKLGIIV
eukprot:COSAG05_NODE_5379_length_1193_cov_1.090494_1_plen_81_part_00